jgi:arylsulfatase A-like enzyme
MKDWTPNSRYGGHAFGFDSFEKFLAQRDTIRTWIAEYSPYALVSRDDPPVYLHYSDAPGLGQPQKDPTHTSNFGVKLQEHCRTNGVACDLVYPGASNVKHATTQDYLIAMLTAGQQAPQPNLLFILTDDQGPHDLRAYDTGTRLETPVLDRLAAGGITIERAYQMGSFVSAVCVPSRHMIMTGRTLWHLPASLTRRTYPEYPDERCPPDIVQHTLPAIFNRAGYATMRTCKPTTSYPEANALFAVNREAWRVGGDDETGSAWHAEQVLDFLREREANRDARPFLIYLGFSHPHDPRHGKPELLAKYGAVNHEDPGRPPLLSPRAPPLPMNYLPVHPFDQGQPGGRDENLVSGIWAQRDEATIRNETGRYFACIENIDIQIGRVLDRLQAMGELGRTYVLFTSDNGIALGRHGLQGKQHLYEHAWRVPFIVQGPGIRPGSRAAGNIYLLDVLATLCDLAGVPVPASNQGMSFRPVLEGRRDRIREVIYGAYCGGTKPGIRAVQRDGWKLVKFDVLDGTVRQTQLFNLNENPAELLEEHHDPRVIALTRNRPVQQQRNLAGDPRYASRQRELEELLLAEMRRHHDPYRLWDQPGDDLPPLHPAPASPAKSGPLPRRK